MKLSVFSEMVLPEIESKMKELISQANQKDDTSLYDMLSYHLGWSQNIHDKRSQGKRIRPILTLLCTESSGGEWKDAIPAAVAIELLHNFSLIHDDIEDQSDLRRGVPSLWKIHDSPLAINAGDAMFSLSFISLSELGIPPNKDINLQAYKILSRACLSLTKGQHLDIKFENLETISVTQYLEMIEGKTAALLGASASMGALIAGVDQELRETYHEFGRYLGFAFQIYDDILGIWGNSNLTGKSTTTDLLSRKKTLPIVYGLEQNGRFKEMWQSKISIDNVSRFSEQLKLEGAFDYAKSTAREFTSLAINEFQKASPSGQYTETLWELIHMLTKREF